MKFRGDGIESQNQKRDTSSTVAYRFIPPNRYTRVHETEGSFGAYLRELKLKPPGAAVLYYDGRVKPNDDVYAAVVDLDIGEKDLHQCADAIMRLKADYHWERGEYDQIHFNLTNGFRMDYDQWRKGRRLAVEGNRTTWDSGSKASTTYSYYWDYMEVIFTYAGTASLEKEMVAVGEKEPMLGDVLIQGGHPGHAVIIVDKVFDADTRRSLYLLAQSYMPAQEIHILLNPREPAISPWYDLNREWINTPEWRFVRGNLRRFAE